MNDIEMNDIELNDKNKYRDHIGRTSSSIGRDLDREYNSKIRDIELDKKMNSWECCSGNSISKELCHYSVQIGFSITIMGFSIYNLLGTENYHDISVSMISMLIGIYLPSPQMKDE
jgi:hypothetical protein